MASLAPLLRASSGARCALSLHGTMTYTLARSAVWRAQSLNRDRRSFHLAMPLMSNTSKDTVTSAAATTSTVAGDGVQTAFTAVKVIEPISSANTPVNTAVEKVKAADTTMAKKPPLWDRIKEEAVHMWHGTKLLSYEVRLSARYILKLMRGNKLSRREQRQLKRTVADLIRLIPFVALILIPFAELALPLLVKIFPNMLPSTFERQFEHEEKKKKLLKGRLEIAKFLRETVSEMAITPETTRGEAAKEFTEFFHKIRSTGEQANTDELLGVARNFKDELTLENLSRPQLVSMCKYMGIKAFGTDNFLRFQIRNKMAQLKLDDKLIQSEGIDSLTMQELQKACQDRGIMSLGVSRARLRHELQQWLDLHLVHKIPSSLIILSRAFIISDRPQIMREKTDETVAQPTADALHATLQSLPENLIHEAELKISEDEGKVTYKKKLEVLQEQEELIAEELAQEARQEEAMRQRKQSSTVTGEVNNETADTKSSNDEDVHISEEQLKELTEAIKVLSSKSAMDNERAELEELKVDHEQQKEKDIDTTTTLSEAVNTPPAAKESSTSTRLSSQVERLITKITGELEQYDSEIGSKLNLIQANEAGQITVSDLEEVLKIIRSKPEDDQRIKKIVKNLDVDNDGLVTVEELLQLAQVAELKEGHGVVVEQAGEGVVESSPANLPKIRD